MRKLEREFNSGELHFYLNGVDERGDGTIRHTHNYPHCLVPLSPMTPLRVFAKLPDHELVQMHGIEDIVTINAGVEHAIQADALVRWTPELVRERAEAIAEALNLVEGKWYCVFSRWGADGYRPDPKIWTGNPYRVTI